MQTDVKDALMASGLIREVASPEEIDRLVEALVAAVLQSKFVREYEEIRHRNDEIRERIRDGARRSAGRFRL